MPVWELLVSTPGLDLVSGFDLIAEAEGAVVVPFEAPESEMPVGDMMDIVTEWCGLNGELARARIGSDSGGGGMAWGLKSSDANSFQWAPEEKSWMACFRPRAWDAVGTYGAVVVDMQAATMPGEATAALMTWKLMDIGQGAPAHSNPVMKTLVVWDTLPWGADGNYQQRTRAWVQSLGGVDIIEAAFYSLPYQAEDNQAWDDIDSLKIELGIAGQTALMRMVDY